MASIKRMLSNETMSDYGAINKMKLEKFHNRLPDSHCDMAAVACS